MFSRWNKVIPSVNHLVMAVNCSHVFGAVLEVHPACGSFSSLVFVLNNLVVLSLTKLIASFAGRYFFKDFRCIFYLSSTLKYIDFFVVQRNGLQKRISLFEVLMYLKVTRSSVFFPSDV